MHHTCTFGKSPASNSSLEKLWEDRVLRMARTAQLCTPLITPLELPLTLPCSHQSEGVRTSTKLTSTAWRLTEHTGAASASGCPTDSM